MPKFKSVLLLGVVACACALSAPTRAQQTVEQFIVEGLRKTGLSDADIAANGRIKMFTSRDVGEGLNLQSGGVAPRYNDGVGKGTLAVVIRNPTSEQWCVRAKGTPPVGQLVRTGVTPHNFIVEPGQTVNMMWGEIQLAADGTYDIDFDTGVALWKPDMSEPDDRQCRAVAPDDLDAWLAQPDVMDYDDYVDMIDFEEFSRM